MSTLPYVTAFYAALIGLLAAALTVNVILKRVALKIDVGDGGNLVMIMAIRTHANLVQHAPLALILIGWAEMGGTSKALIHVLGIALIVARVLSAYGLLTNPLQSFGRQSGAGITVLTLLGASILILLRIAGIM